MISEWQPCDSPYTKRWRVLAQHDLGDDVVAELREFDGHSSGCRFSVVSYVKGGTPDTHWFCPTIELAVRRAAELMGVTEEQVTRAVRLSMGTYA